MECEDFLFSYDKVLQHARVKWFDSVAEMRGLITYKTYYQVIDLFNQNDDDYDDNDNENENSWFSMLPLAFTYLNKFFSVSNDRMRDARTMSMYLSVSLMIAMKYSLDTCPITYTYLSNIINVPVRDLLELERKFLGTIQFELYVRDNSKKSQLGIWTQMMQHEKYLPANIFDARKMTTRMAMQELRKTTVTERSWFASFTVKQEESIVAERQGKRTQKYYTGQFLTPEEREEHHVVVFT